MARNLNILALLLLTLAISAKAQSNQSSGWKQSKFDYLPSEQSQDDLLTFDLINTLDNARNIVNVETVDPTQKDLVKYSGPWPTDPKQMLSISLKDFKDLPAENCKQTLQIKDAVSYSFLLLCDDNKLYQVDLYNDNKPVMFFVQLTKKYTNIVYSEQNNRAYLISRDESPATSVWVTYVELVQGSTPKDVEVTQTAGDSIGSGAISANLIQTKDNTDTIIILQSANPKFNGYVITVDKDKKVVAKRENNTDKSAIDNKPTTDLYNVYNIQSTFYIVTRVKNVQDQTMDYYSSNCSFAEGDLPVKCLDKIYLHGDKITLDPLTDLLIKFILDSTIGQKTRVMILSAKSVDIKNELEGGFIGIVPSIPLDAKDFGIPISMIYKNDLVWIVGQFKSTEPTDVSYNLTVRNTSSNSGSILANMDKLPISLDPTTTFLFAQITSPVFAFQSKDILSYFELTRPYVQINPTLDTSTSLTLNARPQDGTNFNSPTLKLNKQKLYTAPELNFATVGVKFYPGYLSTFPINPNDITGQGMSYEVVWGKGQNESLDKSPKISNEDSKPDIEVIFNNKFDRITWSKDLNTTIFSEIFAVGDGQYITLLKPDLKTLVVFSCYDQNDYGVIDIKCEQNFTVPVGPNTNIKKAMKVTGKDSYALLFNPDKDASVWSKLGVFAFGKDSNGLVISSINMSKAKDIIWVSTSIAVNANTFICYAAWQSVDEKTSGLTADFWTFDGDVYDIKSTGKDLTQDLLSYDFKLIDGIAAYSDGTGILIQSNNFVVEAKMNNPSTDPTDLSYVDFKQYDIKTKYLSLCPCPGYIHQYVNNQSDYFDIGLTLAHKNSDFFYFFKNVKDRTIIDVTCEGFSSFITIRTQDKEAKKYTYLIKRGTDPKNRIQSIANDTEYSRSLPLRLNLQDPTQFKHEVYLSFGITDNKVSLPQQKKQRPTYPD